MIRIILPAHLRTLAGVQDEVAVEVGAPVTHNTILDALERRYPMLAGTIRDHATHKRRPFLRFFACGEDLSTQPMDTPLPGPIGTGQEPYLIIGSVAGG